MAIMIPDRPREFTAASREGLMFDALASLPDTWYVFHSFKMVNTADNELHEYECDFLVFNREKGIICIEAKAGSGIRYQDGKWLYSNGEEMSHNGPFRQASNCMYTLRNRIKDSKMKPVLDHCKMLYGVWFPGIGETRLRQLKFPEDVSKDLVLTYEALSDPEPYLNRICDITTHYNRHDIEKTEVSESESALLMRNIFCPEFNICPTASFDVDLKNIAFHRLLREQANILNFLVDQRFAVINGAAGTGKTLIAVEKAQRLAFAGEKVLFLCYNVRLKEHLEHSNAHSNIDYQTISGLACKLCRTAKPNYERLREKLDEFYYADAFPYKHIIVDEGQDFGMDNIEEGNILETLRTLVEDKGTFYVFYDKLQPIQSRQLPSLIEDADCKLTLYKNCRNTENIATTSLRPVSERKPILFDNAIKGAPAKLHYCNSDAQMIAELDQTLSKCVADGFKDIVILTVKTRDESVLADLVSDGKYRQKYTFSTCRKFKGLEADAVILIDVDADIFDDKNVLLFYVGASRAKISLDILCSLSDEACADVLQNCLRLDGDFKNPRRRLASALNALSVSPTPA